MKPSPADIIGIPIVVAAFIWVGSLFIERPPGPLPVYPNAINAREDVGTSYFLSRTNATHFQTTDSADAVKSFYESELPKHGWHQQSDCGLLFRYSPDYTTVISIRTDPEIPDDLTDVEIGTVRHEVRCNFCSLGGASTYVHP